MRKVTGMKAIKMTKLKTAFSYLLFNSTQEAKHNSMLIQNIFWI